MRTATRSTLAQALSVFTLALGLLSTSCGRVQAACNGHNELCSRKYSNVTVVGAHDSFAVFQGSLAANQNYTVETQLNDGIRMLQGQGHNSNGTIHLCHSTCSLLDAGTLESYLTKVKTWLDANPDEVITLLWVNIDNLPVSRWAAAYAASGMDAYSYTPTSTPVAYDAWPTYQQLITSGKRAVTFLDNGADVSSVPYLLDEFSHVWETAYDATTQAFPCTLDRGAPPTNKMYLINHLLHTSLGITIGNSDAYIVDTARLGQTNAANGTGSLGLQAEQCVAQHGFYPTFMLVDFYDVGGGSVFQVAAAANGVSYTPVTIGNGTTTTGSGSGSNSGGSSSGSGGGKGSNAGTGAASKTSVMELVSLGSAVVGAGVAAVML